MHPQSRPVEFSAARGLGLLRFGIPGTRAGCCAGLRRVHFLRAERHDRFRGGDEPGGKVCCFLKPAVRARPGELLRDRGTAALFEATRPSRGVRLAETGQPCLPTASRDRIGLAGSAEGRWRICRHCTRPVLKHGPRSLTCARVIGSYETQRRSESEGRPGLTQVGSLRSSERGAHHRPVPSALSVGRSRSVHAGTRKMVNYA